MTRTTAFLALVSAVAVLSWMSIVPAASAGPLRDGPVQAAPAGGGSQLPGGASSLQETHGNWRVTCAQPGGKKICTLSQQQADQESRQLVVAIELTTVSADRAEGTLVLPFGLALDRGITLQVDDAPGQALRYRTCLQVGCLVALNFNAATLASLRKGTVLVVKATVDGGQEAAFKLPLAGFSSALDRTAALSK
jgi:invasion protein IalB